MTRPATATGRVPRRRAAAAFLFVATAAAAATTQCCSAAASSPLAPGGGGGGDLAVALHLSRMSRGGGGGGEESIARGGAAASTVASVCSQPPSNGTFVTVEGDVPAVTACRNQTITVEVVNDAEVIIERREVDMKLDGSVVVDIDDDEATADLTEVERTPEEIEAEIEKLTEKKGGPLKVLFLSADTGGGHRASAESLAKSFQMHYPGTTYDLLDVWSPTKVWPYYTLVPAYKHMSSHPWQWKLFYHLSNNYLYEIAYDFHTWITCERFVRKQIASYEPDVVVSVHPTMNNVPMISTRKIAKKEGRDIPFFTVVTDFGSAHTTWFRKGVDGLFVASERIRTLAKRRGCRKDKLVMSGLPIRHDFAVEAERLGDRTSESGLAYQRSVREALGVDTSRNMVLVMGGGEGVGSLSDIVDGLYAKFVRAGVDATIYVVCGRNEKLRTELATKCWDTVLKQSHLPKKRFHPLGFLRPHRSKRIQRALDKAHAKEKAEEAAAGQGTCQAASGKVDVVGLGFVTNMAEYMVASDVLVTKAGPGTIAEAAAVGLPVMLTSFLPGQEAGNVNVVLDGGFGDYCEDPDGIADEVACWLNDERLMREMSHKAREVGHPHAASDIALEIGEITHARMAARNAMAAGTTTAEN